MSEKIDHYAEAKKIASPIQDGPFGMRIEFIQEALLHATLASIEEQRTANLIAMQSLYLTEGLGPSDTLGQEINARLGFAP